MYWAVMPAYDYEIFQRSGGVSWRAVTVKQIAEVLDGRGKLLNQSNPFPSNPFPSSPINAGQVRSALMR